MARWGSGDITWVGQIKKVGQTKSLQSKGWANQLLAKCSSLSNMIERSKTDLSGEVKQVDGVKSRVCNVHALCDANEEMRYSARELSSEAKSKLGIVL